MQEGATPLYMASQEGHKEVAQLLLYSGAQPDIPTKVSTTRILYYNIIPSSNWLFCDYEVIMA
jgi:ankyrin repeat protein